MKKQWEQLYRILNTPLSFRNRWIILAATLLLIPTLLLPLWKLDFWSQQYPEGLELFIYPSQLVGGDDGNDLVEINVLNHYIGMAELSQENFAEFSWIPLIIGLIVILSLRGALIGSLMAIVDIIVFTMYFFAFSMWRFWRMLTTYGHDLDPKAAVHVEPFMPPILGHKMVGQFSVTSLPAAGAYLFGLFCILILLVIYLSIREQKKHSST